MTCIGTDYLENTLNLFQYYRSLGERAMAQVDEKDIHWAYDEDSNNIVTLVKHITGNSLSRWSDFLTTDGEKGWRDRDDEFIDTIQTKAEMIQVWNRGWECLLGALGELAETDLSKTIYIRKQQQTVLEAINRQLAHLPYHVGQIVFVAKMITGKTWVSLTIPKGHSKDFETIKFMDDKK